MEGVSPVPEEKPRGPLPWSGGLKRLGNKTHHKHSFLASPKPLSPIESGIMNILKMETIVVILEQDT